MQGASLNAGDMCRTLQALPGSSYCAHAAFECTAGRGPEEECVRPCSSCMQAVSCQYNHSHVLHCCLQVVNLEGSTAVCAQLLLLPSWPCGDK